VNPSIAGPARRVGSYKNGELEWKRFPSTKNSLNHVLGN